MRAFHVVAASALAAGALAGCEPSAVASPSFQSDIMPILAANCVRCHGVEPIGGASPEFRLDSFANTVIDGVDPATTEDDLFVFGAAAYAMSIAMRVDGGAFPMPPRFPLERWQIDTLIAWAATDPPLRGEPRPGNRLPVLELRELGRDATTIELEYELHDPDGDLVVGQLCDDDGVTCVFVAPLQSGRHTLLIDTTRFSLPIVLRSKLDDGAGVIEQAARGVEGA